REHPHLAAAHDERGDAAQGPPEELPRSPKNSSAAAQAAAAAEHSCGRALNFVRTSLPAVTARWNNCPSSAPQAFSSREAASASFICPRIWSSRGICECSPAAISKTRATAASPRSVKKLPQPRARCSSSEGSSSETTASSVLLQVEMRTASRT
ncbi:hypothetical protein NE577_15635, partial [Cloacibacillus evryensis]